VKNATDKFPGQLFVTNTTMYAADIKTTIDTGVIGMIVAVPCEWPELILFPTAIFNFHVFYTELVP